MVFCTYCGQAFTRDEHLERHILTHTNVKPFKCYICPQTFARRDLLQRHYVTHGRDTYGISSSTRPATTQNSTSLSSSKISSNHESAVEVSSTRLYLGNLPSSATKADIEAHFATHGCGEIESIKLMNGFGFIEYTDPLDARDVVPAFHGTDFMGNRLHEQFARGRRKQEPVHINRPRPRSAEARSVEGLTSNWNFGLGDKSISSNERQVFEIPSYVGERNFTNALGDYCAKFNFMREEYALTLGLDINKERKSEVSIGTGKKVATLGTATAFFRFQDEHKRYSLLFHILPKCVHDVILGRSFLKVTETFSAIANLARRVKTRILKGKFYHLLYLGDSVPRFEGRINGIPQHGLADSGAKVMIMDEDYARSIGLPISTGRRHRTKLMFADESTAYTSGIAYGVKWEFGSGGIGEYTLDFHILKNAPANVILSDSFLFGTEAYSQYNCFLIDDDDDDDDEAFFFAIDVAQSYAANDRVDMTTLHNMRYKEDILRDRKEDRIMNLTTKEAQDAERARVDQRRSQWDLEYNASQRVQAQQQVAREITSPHSTFALSPLQPDAAAPNTSQDIPSPPKRFRWRLKLKHKIPWY